MGRPFAEPTAAVASPRTLRRSLHHTLKSRDTQTAGYTFMSSENNQLKGPNLQVPPTLCPPATRRQERSSRGPPGPSLNETDWCVKLFCSLCEEHTAVCVRVRRQHSHMNMQTVDKTGSPRGRADQLSRFHRGALFNLPPPTPRPPPPPPPRH